MGESGSSVDCSKAERNVAHTVRNPMFPKLLVQLPNMIQDRLKMQFKRLHKGREGVRSFDLGEGSSSGSGVATLERESFLG